MNKKTLIIFILLLGFMYMPNVFAAELPREGVTYFMTYPNNEEVVTESYDEAVSEPERLIFEGVTDSNGQVTITGLGNQGEVRVESNGIETTVNLTNQRTAEIKPKSVVNPKTGATFLFVILLVTGLTLVTIKTKKKKVLLLVPVVIAVTILSNVKAAEDDFVVTIKNSLGQAVSGTPVKVYAKPIKVEGAPAVKYDANGGHFFDGKTVMYFRLPSNGCSIEEFFNSLGEEKFYYLRDNNMGAYREGYYVAPSIGKDVTLTNGTVIKIEWEQDSSANLVAVHGNGGYLDFYGEKLSDVFIYDESSVLADLPSQKMSGIPNEESAMAKVPIRYISPYGAAMSFINDGKHNIGPDTASSCSNYDQYGIIKNPEKNLNNSNDIYACWHEKPDGIYVNDKASFIFSPDSTCDYYAYYNGDGYEYDYYKENYSAYLSFESIYNDDLRLSFFDETYERIAPILPPTEVVDCKDCNMLQNVQNVQNHAFNNQSSRSIKNEGMIRECDETKAINKIEIIKNGQSFLTLTSNDLESEMCNNYPSYSISNTSKLNTLKNYIQSYANRCVQVN